MKRFDEDFPSSLDGFNFETLEKNPCSIYGLTKDLSLNYFNPSWFQFSQANGGEPDISERFGLGTYVGETIVGPAKDYYLEVFKGILQTGKVWHHDYECSSPDTFRMFHQSVYPLYSREGLLIVNTLVREHSHKNKVCLPDEVYLQKTGFISQCCNCRRVQRGDNEEIWDWVPAWVESMPENTSHTFCQLCYEYYYEFKFPVK